MFHSSQLVTKLGPLGVIWTAAHLDRQLKRAQIAAASVPDSVDALLAPSVQGAPLALRLSGQLLLGLVRVYARQVGYLAADVEDVLARITGILAAAAAAAAASKGADDKQPAGEEGGPSSSRRRGGKQAAGGAVVLPATADDMLAQLAASQGDGGLLVDLDADLPELGGGRGAAAAGALLPGSGDASGLLALGALGAGGSQSADLLLGSLNPLLGSSQGLGSALPWAMEDERFDAGEDGGDDDDLQPFDLTELDALELQRSMSIHRAASLAWTTASQGAGGQAARRPSDDEGQQVEQRPAPGRHAAGGDDGDEMLDVPDEGYNPLATPPPQGAPAGRASPPHAPERPAQAHPSGSTLQGGGTSESWGGGGAASDYCSGGEGFRLSEGPEVGSAEAGDSQAGTSGGGVAARRGGAAAADAPSVRPRGTFSDQLLRLAGTLSLQRDLEPGTAQAATTLPAAEVRALLADRSPLMVQRQRRKRVRPQQAAAAALPQGLDASTAAVLKGSMLDWGAQAGWPASLLALYAGGMGGAGGGSSWLPPGGGDSPRKQPCHRQQDQARARPGAGAEEEEEQQQQQDAGSPPPGQPDSQEQLGAAQSQGSGGAGSGMVGAGHKRGRGSEATSNLGGGGTSSAWGGGQEGGGDEDEQDDSTAAPLPLALQHAGFTQRTAAFLAVAQRSSAERAAAGARPAPLQLEQLIPLLPAKRAQGGPRGMAARCFFESLVLQNRGFVTLHQPEAYREVSLAPTARFAQPSGA